MSFSGLKVTNLKNKYSFGFFKKCKYFEKFWFFFAYENLAVE